MPATEPTSFMTSFRIQRRVIWALLMREIITRYGRNNLGFLWMFLAPMLLISLIISARSFKAENLHGISIIAFVLSGYSGAFMLRKIAGRCMNAIVPNQSLMFHSNVRVIDIYAARMLLEIAGETMAFFFLLLACWFLGLIPAPVDPLKMLLGWLLLTGISCALACTMGPLSEMFQVVEKIWPPINILLFILSGAFFMVDWLPESSQQLLLLLPWIHGMELLREGFFGSIVRAHYDVEYAIVWCLGLTLCGLMLIRSAASKKP